MPLHCNFAFTTFTTFIYLFLPSFMYAYNVILLLLSSFFQKYFPPLLAFFFCTCFVVALMPSSHPVTSKRWLFGQSHNFLFARQVSEKWQSFSELLPHLKTPMLLIV